MSAMTIKGFSKPKEASISARIIRANGTIEDVGVVSYWHRNPFKLYFWRLRQWLHSL